MLHDFGSPVGDGGANADETLEALRVVDSYLGRRLERGRAEARDAAHPIAAAFSRTFTQTERGWDRSIAAAQRRCARVVIGHTRRLREVAARELVVFVTTLRAHATQTTQAVAVGARLARPQPIRLRPDPRLIRAARHRIHSKQDRSDATPENESACRHLSSCSVKYWPQ